MPHDFVSLLLPLPEAGDTLIPSSSMQSYIGIAPQTLARWRYEGKGPRYIKIGRKVAYKVNDIKVWLKSDAAS